MDQVNGAFPKDDPLGLAKLGFKTKEEGDAYLESLDLSAVDGLKDRASALKENLANHDSISDKDPVIHFSLLADKQEEQLNETAINGDDESSEVSSNNTYREKLINGEEEEVEADAAETSPDKPPKDDPLGLAKLGYTKEQVDAWLSEGYSVAEIRSGLAASGNKNTTENTETLVS